MHINRIHQKQENVAEKMQLLDPLILDQDIVWILILCLKILEINCK